MKYGLREYRLLPSAIHIFNVGKMLHIFIYKLSKTIISVLLKEILMLARFTIFFLHLMDDKCVYN